MGSPKPRAGGEGVVLDVGANIGTTTVIERAVARGDLPADVDVDLLVTLVAGPLVYTKLVRRQRVTEELVAAAVDTVLARYAVHDDLQTS